ANTWQSISGGVQLPGQLPGRPRDRYIAAWPVRSSFSCRTIMTSSSSAAGRRGVWQRRGSPGNRRGGGWRLQRGPDPRPIPELIADPAQQQRLLLESPCVQMYPTPRQIDGSHFYSLAGRIMGGGSSVNVTSLPRPLKYDLDRWAAFGNPAWSYDQL